LIGLPMHPQQVLLLIFIMGLYHFLSKWLLQEMLTRL
jgi:hypothetical protein